jgi:cytosine/uracil/thiamine/allantoin permease
MGGWGANGTLGLQSLRGLSAAYEVQGVTLNPNRIILGVYGSYIGMLIRILLSIIWYGSQAWLGGLCVSVILSSWSHSFLTMPNTFPESAHMVTRDFIGFVIFHIISVPFMVGSSQHPPQ